MVNKTLGIILGFTGIGCIGIAAISLQANPNLQAIVGMIGIIFFWIGVYLIISKRSK